jgi:hypothetical protein
MRSEKNATLLMVIDILAGKHLKREHYVKMPIAGNVMFTVLWKTTLI